MTSQIIFHQEESVLLFLMGSIIDSQASEVGMNMISHHKGAHKIAWQYDLPEENDIIFLHFPGETKEPHDNLLSLSSSMFPGRRAQSFKLESSIFRTLI